MSDKLTLNVIEVIHYASDVDEAIGFYRDKLGWPVIWQSPGNMAVIDAGGAYQLSVVAAKWTPGWAEGQPVPGPQPSLESKHLEGDVAELQRLGLPGLEVGGDPGSMLTTSITDPAGTELFVWQDTTEASATKVVEAYRSSRQADPLYSGGECVLFVEDMAAGERFYTEVLGFVAFERHGDAFIGLRRADGPVLGLYHRPQWWDQPVSESVAAPVRLFLECGDVEREWERQRAAGAEPGELAASGDGLQWFTTADPDGTAMTFWAYKPQA